jgi:hypothetical protein
MSKHQNGVILLVAGIAIHAYGNGKKFYDQQKAGTKPSGNDWTYYLATLALVAGAAILWPSIK